MRCFSWTRRGHRNVCRLSVAVLNWWRLYFHTCARAHTHMHTWPHLLLSIVRPLLARLEARPYVTEAGRPRVLAVTPWALSLTTAFQVCRGEFDSPCCLPPLPSCTRVGCCLVGVCAGILGASPDSVSPAGPLKWVLLSRFACGDPQARRLPLT